MPRTAIRKQIKVNKDGKDFLVDVVHKNELGFTIEHLGRRSFFLTGQLLNSAGYRLVLDNE